MGAPSRGDSQRFQGGVLVSHRLLGLHFPITDVYVIGGILCRDHVALYLGYTNVVYLKFQ